MKVSWVALMVGGLCIGGCGTADRPVVYGLVDEPSAKTDAERHVLQREVLAAVRPDGRVEHLPAPRPQYQRFLSDLEYIEMLLESGDVTGAEKHVALMREQVGTDLQEEKALLKKLETSEGKAP